LKKLIFHYFYLGISVLHHAIDSKNFETVAVIVRQLKQDKEFEINRQVGTHKWTPLYRAGKNIFFYLDKKNFLEFI
jgi:hypothetical protein